MESGLATRPVSRPARTPSGRPVGPKEPNRLRRIAIIASLIVLVPVVFSYVGVLTQTSNTALGIRTVEWLRDNGAAGIVARVESIYYTLTAPSKGGPTLKALPHIGVGVAAGSTAAGEYRPGRVHAILHPALPGEGVWHATRASLAADPPVLLTTIRDQPEYPRVVVGLAWIDTALTHIALNPGRLEPSVELPRGPMEVPPLLRPRLLATFNSGFKLVDSKGGFIVNGTQYARMVNGQGTIVGYTDGRVDVIDWTYGPHVPAGVSFARQNLPLIANEGKTVPGIENSSAWGATVENAVLVWRSGVGIDAHGNLIYASGEDQTVESIAKALIRAGAVRAMELDINSYWTSFISYGAPGAGQPKNLLPGMERSALRYLEPDDRDFFTVYQR